MASKSRKSPARIKSPQLYQLSYQPKSPNQSGKPEGEPALTGGSVSPVYPGTAPKFKHGSVVVVTDGLSRGKHGVVEDRAQIDFDGIPVWAVRFPMPLGVRAIREDYLALAIGAAS